MYFTLRVKYRTFIMNFNCFERLCMQYSLHVKSVLVDCNSQEITFDYVTIKCRLTKLLIPLTQPALNFRLILANICCISAYLDIIRNKFLWLLHATCAE